MILRVWSGVCVGAFLFVILASPLLAFALHCLPSSLSLLKLMESLIGDLKCQQDLGFPLLVTSSLKALSAIISLLYWIGHLGLHHVHIFHALYGIVCVLHSVRNQLTDWVIYSHSIASLICYRFIPCC